MFSKEAEGVEQEDMAKTTAKKHKVGGKKGGKKKKGHKKHGKKHGKKKMAAK
jgi:hypothetical protein